MNTVVKLAEENGWLYYHTYLSKKYPKGFPDLVLVKPPHRVIFAELKMPYGELTDDQKKWRRALRFCPGVRYFLWRPKDWNAIHKTLT